MDEALVTWHNEIVKPEDSISFLGDVTMRRGGREDKDWFIKEIKKYNGHKRLYLGNHDHFPISVYLEAGFEKVYATWRDQDGILFSHMPVHPRSLGSAVANVHGHIHQQPDYEPVIWVGKDQKIHYTPYINISLERTDYLPIHRDELLARIARAKGVYEKEDAKELEGSTFRSEKSKIIDNSYGYRSKETPDDPKRDDD